MGLFQQLDNEWARLIASGDTRRAALQWRRTQPALAEALCAEDLMRRIRNAQAPSHSDELLSALARLAPTDTIAARTVLQTLIPGLRTLARTLAARDDAEEIDAAIVAAAWTRIRTYPHDRRPRRIAANIVLDTKKEVLRTHPLRDVAEGRRVALVEARDDSDPEPDLTEVLRDAVERRVVNSFEAMLIRNTRVLGATLADQSRQLGISADAVRKRRARAEWRLKVLA